MLPLSTSILCESRSWIALFFCIANNPDHLLYFAARGEGTTRERTLLMRTETDDYIGLPGDLLEVHVSAQLIEICPTA